MADDPTQRPYRSHETLARAPARAPGPPSGGDPLAELARLIGQNDPFSEFGRDGQRRVAAAPSGNGYAAPAIAPTAPLMRDDPPYNPPNSGRQNFGGAPLATGAELYQTEHHQVPGYPPTQYSGHPSGHQSGYDAGYDDARYHPGKPHLEPEEEDLYEDEHPRRRRMGVLVIAGVFALAVIGTAGAFGYRALFGSFSTAAPPPVIKADSAPSKIVPVSNKDSASNKQITDRVNDRGMGEKLVSREEQPVSPQAQDPAPSSSPQLGSGVIGSEAKRVRTIAIRPDQGPTADATPASPQPTTPARAASARPAAAPPPPRIVSNSPPATDPEPAPAPRQATPRAASPVQQAAAPEGNAPLSLSPDAAPARPAPVRASAPVRTAAVSAKPTQLAVASSGNGGGSYAVQISSQRSEAEAQAAFRGLQGKFPSQLGGKQPLIRQVDLGDKGIYYRAMVGPFANGSEATELCGSLKAAGGQCIVQRN